MLTDDQHILRMRTDRGSALHHVPAVSLARLQPEHLARALVLTDLLRGIVLLADGPCNRGDADAGWRLGGENLLVVAAPQSKVTPKYYFPPK